MKNYLSCLFWSALGALIGSIAGEVLYSNKDKVKDTLFGKDSSDEEDKSSPIANNISSENNNTRDITRKSAFNKRSHKFNRN